VMDVAGLVLGVIVLIKPLCVTIHDAWSSQVNFGKDAERFRLRFSVQSARIDSFEKVLFEENKFMPSMPGRLIDHLPSNISKDMVDLLRQLYGLLFEYTSVKARYEFESRSKAAGMTTPEDRMNALVLEGDNADMVQQKSVGWARKMMWVMWDKRSTEKLVVEFEEWTDRMKALLEVVWWPLPYFETVAKMQKLEEDVDAKNIGLLHGIGLRKLLAAPQAVVPFTTKQKLEIAHIHFHAESHFGDLEFGFLRDNTTTRYLVEYKTYERDNMGAVSEVVSRRIVQLAALLHEAAQTDPLFKVCKCIHYFDDIAEKRVGFVYELPLPPSSPSPAAAASPSAVFPHPISLASLLVSKKLRPTLRTRVRLAHTLANSLRLLHSFEWVHKSLRSDIIIFFTFSATSTPNSHALEDEDRLHLDDPRITGFEYARLESDFSSARPETEIRRNVYRHPVRWGKPSERFTKLHDIYGTYTLLLRFLLLAWTNRDH
jgi:hypothetical protein